MGGDGGLRDCNPNQSDKKISDKTRFVLADSVNRHLAFADYYLINK